MTMEKTDQRRGRFRRTWTKDDIDIGEHGPKKTMNMENTDHRRQ